MHQEYFLILNVACQLFNSVFENKLNSNVGKFNIW